MDILDLRSDTVTLPCAGMREAMARAKLGDDVYGEDPTVNQLETTAADMLGKQAAMFVPSGTQSNLLALLTHCGRGDEYIVGQGAHTYRLEGGGAAALGGIQPQPLEFMDDGSIDLQQVSDNIKPDDFHFAKTKLLCLENTNSGRAISLDYIDAARRLCDERDICLHLDGARFFNAAAAVDAEPRRLAQPFHSVSICLSKGLGAPVGSVLVGDAAFIAQARRWRKMVGGGMRQAGIIAAGGLYALQNNVARLKQDHQHAETVARVLIQKFGEESISYATNMVFLGIDKLTYDNLSKHLGDRGIRVGRPRWVFHLDIQASGVDRLVTVLQAF